MIKIGCCGFARGRREYFSQFKLVEIQAFYQMSRLETALRWRDEAPPHFEFTLKASQLITHPLSSPTYRRAGLKITPNMGSHYGFFRPTEAVFRAWEETKRFAQILRAKVIVFQCPLSFKETPESLANMKRFFKAVRTEEFLFVWEPRGDWREMIIKAVCSELGLSPCLGPLTKESLYGEIQYFRLHGGSHYRHQYTEEELKCLRDKAKGRKSYVLFNNLNMFQDVLAFKHLVESSRDG